jgi:long-subunit acyl-CoA synthetase (AMP-forming)
MMGPDYTHWHGTYDLAKHWYSKFVPQLEELIAKGMKEGGEKQKAAENLQKELTAMLNSDDHKWYLDKLTDAQKAMRKQAVERFKDQMEGKVGASK